MTSKALAFLLCAALACPHAFAANARRVLPKSVSAASAPVRLAVEIPGPAISAGILSANSPAPLLAVPASPAARPAAIGAAADVPISAAAVPERALTQLEQTSAKRPPARASAAGQAAFWRDFMDGSRDSSKEDPAPVPGRESGAGSGLVREPASGEAPAKPTPPTPKGNFRARLATAAVLVPVLLSLVHWGGFAYSAFIMAVTGLALQEYGALLGRARFPVQRFNVVAAGLGVAGFLAFGGTAAPALAAGAALVVLTEMFSAKPSLERAALTLFGAVFLGGTLPYLVLIRNLEGGRLFTYFLFLTVWNNDNLGYLVGGSWGRHKLAPYLSPKKTWEGAISGFLGGAATALAVKALTALPLTWTQALFLGCLVGVAGQVSDLAESMVKRAVGAKDSGTLLPGHGGFMDRFDSYILAAAAMYYFLVLWA